ncbi:hypothetical protein HDU85_000611 [Gaertneriomyces sp. JEL0708]|nr:hypothetical protein HDU85_000611 [Gaertneriomyces sp. JEL0708]
MGMRALQRALQAGGRCLLSIPARHTRPFASLAGDPSLLLARSTSESTFTDVFDNLVKAVAGPADPAVEYRKKYEEKLRRVAEKEGAKSIHELIEKKRSSPQPSGSEPGPDKAGKPPGKKATASSSTPSALPSHVKKLGDIVDLGKLKLETPDRIKNIWNEYHSTRNCLSGAMGRNFYTQLVERSRQFPLFIVPLPRNEGYEFFLLQFSGDQVYFTPLLEYKTHRENARPHLVITHYPDLAEEKDVVLMVGELGDPERKFLTLQEAQNLVYQMQLFYVTGPPEKTDLVEIFHKNPAQFDYNQLINALETLE